MAEVALTYDVDRQHVAFKKSLKALGYVDQIKYPQDTAFTNLPNTTLYHLDRTAGAARDETRALAKSMGVVLERCIAFEVNAWASIIGQQHAS